MDVNATLIKDYRQRTCCSQQQLAEMAGLSIRTLQRVEKTATASMETVKSIAAVMEIDAADLLSLPIQTTPIKNPIESQPALNKQTPDDNEAAASLVKRKRRRLIVGIVLVVAVNALALAMLFYRHNQAAIDETTFYYLKNILSITTVVSIGVALVQGFRAKVISKDDFY